MDPLSLAIGAVGLGLQVFGGFGSSSAASKYSQQANLVQQNEITHEQQINTLKQQAMEMNGRRQQMEDIRNTQRARAQAIQAAVSQGAQYGTGLAGGLSQITNQGLFDLSGVNSALQTGRAINTENQALSQDKIQMSSLNAQYQSTQATDQGMMSIGGALLKSGPTIGALGKGIGGFKFNGLFGGGSPSGYGV